jgi:hypothetical protein
LGLLAAGLAPGEAQRRYVVAFANLTEEPGVTVEGTGFTGREIRESFTLAARAHPVEMVFYDNQRDEARAVANVEAAIARKVDLYIQYHRGAANTVVAEKLKAAGIPLLAMNYPIPGGAGLYRRQRGGGAHRGRGACPVRRPVMARPIEGGGGHREPLGHDGPGARAGSGRNGGPGAAAARRSRRHARHEG